LVTILRGTIAAIMAAAALGAAAYADDAPALGEGETAPLNVRGWLELARVQPANLLMRAKLESGARTSAIHAEILRGPEGHGYPTDLSDGVEIDDAADDADGDTIVFELESRTGKDVVFEREIVRWVTIKMRGGGTADRPVVRLAFCVGGLPMEGEVSLADRDNFNYPILLGREMLTDARVVIDPSQTFTYHAGCNEDGPHPNVD
jgi:hypothetical protein